MCDESCVRSSREKTPILNGVFKQGSTLACVFDGLKMNGTCALLLLKHDASAGFTSMGISKAVIANTLSQVIRAVSITLISS